MSIPQVSIFDTTLRDGEQTPGVHLRQEEKVRLARELERLGVDVIEAGFPVSSPGDFAAVEAVAREIVSAEVAALARCREEDIEAAARALAHARRPVIHVVLGVSDIHLEHKLRITRARAVRTIERAVRHAKRHVAQVQFSLEDSTRAERVFVRQCIETAVCAGATRINLADTVGCALPDEYGELIGDAVAFVRGAAIVSAHCHDDLGLAVANAIAAVRAGARQVECTINGIGERAGNTALEAVAVTLHLKNIARTNIDHARIAGVSAAVAEATGVAVAPNRAIVGANAFAHSSGIHQDGILKHAANYAFVAPEFVGAPGHRFIMTARSGRSALANWAKTRGIEMESDAFDAFYKRFLDEADRCGGAVDEAALEALAHGLIAVKKQNTGRN